MNLKIGLTIKKPGWQIILQQEGVPSEVVSDLNEINPANFSALIVSGFNTKHQKESILEYVRTGGAVLVDSAMSSELLDFKARKRKIRYLIPERGPIYSDVGLVNLDLNGKLLQAKNLTALDKGLKINTIRIGRGIVLVLPFDVNEAILDYTTARRKFYFKRRELPSERVAKVSKGEIRKIVKISLEFLHYFRNLPFIQLWYYPNGAMNVFIFRVDTDFCQRADVKELYKVCEKNSIPGSWFVETKTSEKWIPDFKQMRNQEIGLHCYWHRVFKDYQSNYNNIKKGLTLLKKSGIHPIGFVSPCGEWNYNLARAIEELGFEYSSEFCLDYDDLPFYPSRYISGENRFSKVLQILIHPICTGRLTSSHFSEEEMWKYFKAEIEYKIKLNEPIILYHHPINNHFSLWDKIFQLITFNNISKMNFREYARWWNVRVKNKLNARIIDGNVFIESGNTFPSSLWLRISSSKGSSIIPIKSKISLNRIKWETKRENIELPNDLTRSRRFSWHDWLYDMENLRYKLAPIHNGDDKYK
jgi:hypothetical protein